MEKQIEDLEGAKEQLEYAIECLEQNKDYKEEIKYLKGLIEQLDYDIEIKQEELQEIKELEAEKQKNEYYEYLEDCEMAFNCMRV